MRSLSLVLLFAATTLAGCTATDDSDLQPDYVGTCPAWTQGLDRFTVNGLFHVNSTKFNDTDEIRSLPLERNDRELDHYVLEFSGVFVQDGRLTARAYREDTGAALLIRDFRYAAQREMVPQLTFESGLAQNLTFFVHLGPPDEPPQPTAIRIEWLFERNLDNDPETASDAAYAYTARGMYRVCGADALS
ncbi:MAG: hypothetical protein ACPGQL_02780 [Thermoplasmatota archaeon]